MASRCSGPVPQGDAERERPVPAVGRGALRLTEADTAEAELVGQVGGHVTEKRIAGREHAGQLEENPRHPESGVAGKRGQRLEPAEGEPERGHERVLPAISHSTEAR